LTKMRRKIPWIVLSAAGGLFALAGHGWTQSADANIHIQPFAGVPPGVVLDLAASPGTGEGQVNLTWTAPGVFPGSNPEAYQLRIQTFSVADVGGSTSTWWNSPAGSSIQGLYSEASGSQVQRIVGVGAPDHAVSLFPGATYYFSVRTADNVGFTRNFWSNVSAIASTRALDIAPATPHNFTAVNGNAQVSLGWADLTSLEKTLDFAHYRLERSTDGVTFVSVTTTTAVSYLDTGLINHTVYTYRLIGVDQGPPGSALESAPAVLAAIPTPDARAPAVVAGLSGQLSVDGQSFTLGWSTVTTNSDGTPITDLAFYRVIRSTELFASATTVFNITLPQTSFTDTVNGGTFYYTVRAVDSDANESLISNYVVSMSTPPVLMVGDDGESYVTVQSGISAELRKENNDTGSNLVVTATRMAAEETDNVLKSYRFEVRRAENYEVVSNFAFSKPMLKVAMGFATGTGAGTLAQSNKRLSVYWDNGARFISLGGDINFTEQTISVVSSNPGQYQLRFLKGAGGILTAGSPYPRVITPNGDEVNDRAFFFFETTDASADGKIYDLNSAFVASMKPGPVQDASFVWDGKDSSGHVVPMGVYLYKVAIGKESVTGTIVVAR